MGSLDEMFDPADFIEMSLTWAAGVLHGAVQTVTRPEIDRGRCLGSAVSAGASSLKGKAARCGSGAHRELWT